MNYIACLPRITAPSAGSFKVAQDNWKDLSAQSKEGYTLKVGISYTMFCNCMLYASCFSMLLISY